jgi:predicted DNA-binding protein
MTFDRVKRRTRKKFENRKAIFARIPESEYKKLEDYALAKGESKNIVIKQAIEREIERGNNG